MSVEKKLHWDKRTELILIRCVILVFVVGIVGAIGFMCSLLVESVKNMRMIHWFPPVNDSGSRQIICSFAQDALHIVSVGPESVNFSVYGYVDHYNDLGFVAGDDDGLVPACLSDKNNSTLRFVSSVNTLQRDDGIFAMPCIAAVGCNSSTVIDFARENLFVSNKPFSCSIDRDCTTITPFFAYKYPDEDFNIGMRSYLLLFLVALLAFACYMLCVNISSLRAFDRREQQRRVERLTMTDRNAQKLGFSDCEMLSNM